MTLAYLRELFIEKILGLPSLEITDIKIITYVLCQGSKNIDQISQEKMVK